LERRVFAKFGEVAKFHRYAERIGQGKAHETLMGKRPLPWHIPKLFLPAPITSPALGDRQAYRATPSGFVFNPF